MEDRIYEFCKDLTANVGNLLMRKVFIAVLDRIGQLYYSDQDLDDMVEFIQTYTRTNFKVLSTGDHSIPLSNLNLVFFKISENLMVVLFMKDGRVGQLLTFKRKMGPYGVQLEELLADYIHAIPDEVFADEQVDKIPDIVANTDFSLPQVDQSSFQIPDKIISPDTPQATVESPVEISKPPEEVSKPTEEVVVEDGKIKEIPHLLREVGDKDKFSINTSVIFQYCNGKNTIDEIVDKANLSRDEVGEILERYQNKGWIRIQIIESQVKREFKIFPKIGKVSLALGFNPDDVAVLEKCNGKASLVEIAEQTGIDIQQVADVIERHENQKWMSIKWEGYPVIFPKNVKAINPSAVQLGLMSKKEYNIRELATGENTASAIAAKLSIPMKELMKKLNGYEKKKTVELKIQYY